MKGHTYRWYTRKWLNGMQWGLQCYAELVWRSCMNNKLWRVKVEMGWNISLRLEKFEGVYYQTDVNCGKIQWKTI